MTGIWNDIRYSIRRIGSSPATTLAILLTLAIGIGASTAVFSLVEAILLRPLPYPESDRIVYLAQSVEGGESTTSPSDYRDWRDQSTSFDAMTAMYPGSAAWNAPGEPEQLKAGFVHGGFFNVLGVQPEKGRGFQSSDEVDGAGRVAVLSHSLWQRRFGGAEAAIGQVARINGRATTIVGVMPPGFAFPRESDLWIPLQFSEKDFATQRGAHYLMVLARLRDGVTPSAAAVEMRGIGERLAADYPNTNADMGNIIVRPLLENVVKRIRPQILMLSGAVILLLLIACTNVANVLISRGLGRAREISIRSALGAGRWRLFRQLLTESLMLALAGGILGVLLAALLTSAISSIELSQIPRLSEATLNREVLAVAAVLSAASGLFFGIIPALFLLGPISKRVSEGTSRSGAGRETRLLRSILVVSEVGLAVLLLSAAGVLIRSFVALTAVDPGFDARGVIAFDVDIPKARYPEVADRSGFQQRMIERIESIPSVTRAATVFGLPMSDFNYMISISEIDETRTLPDDERSLHVRIITPGYLETLKIPLLRGRGLTDSDVAGAPDAILLNESAAKLVFGETDPIGRSIRIGTRFGGDRRAGGTVVGLISDFHHDSLADPPRPEIFLSAGQFPADSVTVAVRTAGNPESIIPGLRGALAAIDPEVPIYDVRTLEQAVDETVSTRRAMMMMLIFFAATGLLLAGIGIYGVISYGVSQRTRELGIRIALGAERARIMRGVIREAVALTVAGLAAGILGFVALKQLLARFVFGISPTDITTQVVAASIILLIAVAGAWAPAWRASRVEPVRALREE
ncbi:MAG TPA: ABC transporter permease [Thermoanaerobaculia bacterium]|nr:ABC transporter permease [Thermoanaerobaculia bacterium]